MQIVVEGLKKRYGAVQAVDDATFTASAGRVTGFLGPNGSGKTTTLRCLLGLARPDAGTASFDGRPYRELGDPPRSVGAVLSPDAHHSSRTGQEHLRIIADASGTRRARVEDVLHIVELGEAAGRRAGGYSLGMRQRLHLAAALLGDPEALVLDEPATGLDPAGIRWLRDFLRGLATEGRTILLSSHVLPEVQATVEDVVVIAKGKIAAQGPLRDVFRNGASRVHLASAEIGRLAEILDRMGARVRTDDGRAMVEGLGAEEIAAAALDARILVTQLITEEPDLEEAFLTMTSPGAE